MVIDLFVFYKYKQDTTGLHRQRHKSIKIAKLLIQ